MPSHSDHNRGGNVADRFNAPPGWPTPPAGWVPPKDWRPDPSWPPAPPGWHFWIPDTAPTLPHQAAPLRQAGPPATTVTLVPSTAPSAVMANPELPADANSAQPSSTAVDHGGGLFGRRKRLEEDNARLREQNDQVQVELAGVREQNRHLQAELTRLLGLSPAHLAAERDRAQAELANLQQQVAAARQALSQVNTQVAAVRAQLVQTQEVALLQEAGVYEYVHPLDDAVAYKGRLATLQDRIKSMARGGSAILATTNWTVNGSVREGQAMVRDFSKLMLRAYNAEADNCVRTVRPHRVQATSDRLSKVRDTIARLGKTMDIRISNDYHQARLQEIRLTADYLGKVEDEKERVRAERERQREEERARREFEREKARLAKEQAHYNAVLARLQASGATDELAKVESKLAEIQSAIIGIEAREANVRAGYVYVISNVGAFGPDMVKIGMTRRLEPQDRIRELGDASVPFRFDTHALIFSEDAVSLETRLHNELADRKVNRVNERREFFYATPAEVRDILQRIAGNVLLEYREIPEALEWRGSGQTARQTPAPAVAAAS